MRLLVGRTLAVTAAAAAAVDIELGFDLRRTAVGLVLAEVGISAAAAAAVVAAS